MLNFNKYRWVTNLSFLPLIFANACFGQSKWEWLPIHPQKQTLNCVIYGADRFMSVGDSGTILTSTDGMAWTIQSSGTTKSLFSVIHCNDQFMAVGEGGTILTSSDGAMWTPKSSAITTTLTSVTFGAGRYVAVGHGGVIITSSDGTTWTKQSPGITNWLQSVTYGAGRYMAVGHEGSILTSLDGTTWTLKSLGTANTFFSVIYAKNQFMIAGVHDDGSPGPNVLPYGVIYTAADGEMWNYRIPGTGTLKSAIYAENRFVAVGSNNAIISSSDGTTWTKIAEIYNSLQSIAYGSNQFVAVGFEGAILVAKTDTPVAIRPSVSAATSNRITIALANDRLSALVPASSLSGPFHIKIFSVAGKCVYRSSTEAGTSVLTISTTGFPRGTLLMNIDNGADVNISSTIVLSR